MGKLRIRGIAMLTGSWKNQLNNEKLEVIKSNLLPVISCALPKLQEKLLMNVEQARTVLVHFDHIQGESENDRDQIFSDVLRAATYFGLNIEKVDFHRVDR